MAKVDEEALFVVKNAGVGMLTGCLFAAVLLLVIKGLFILAKAF